MDAPVLFASAVSDQPRLSIAVTLFCQVVMDASLWHPIADCQRLPITGFRNNPRMTLASRIKDARAAIGWSRRALSDAAQVPYATLAGIENGDQTSSTATPQLAAALGVSAVWLATGKGQKVTTGTSVKEPELTDPYQPASGTQLVRLDMPTLLDTRDVIAAYFKKWGQTYSFIDDPELVLYAYHYMSDLTDEAARDAFVGELNKRKQTGVESNGEGSRSVASHRVRR
jgi:transcriptional regulator with XRE-family HTH domain